MIILSGKEQLKIASIIAIVAIAALLIFSSSALAGGWHTIGDTDDPDAGQWLKSNSPHAGLQSSTNQCRTCHSVHNADNVGQSIGTDMNNDGDDTDPGDVGTGKAFKLLRNENRISECNACHDAASGLSTKRPYQVGEFKQVRGEHSLGSTIIPDSDPSILFNGINKNGLTCGNCHSVHGSNVVQNNPANGQYADPAWASKILRADPGGNGGDASKGTAHDSGSGNIAGGLTVTAANSNAANGYAGSKTAFCADCHNRNSNWDPDSDDERPNNESHVQGPNVDGNIVVNGVSTQVANFGTFSNQETTDAGRTGWRLDQNTARGCVSCHQATSGGATFPYDGTSSSFPHQSTSSKLLQGNYTQAESGWVNESDSNGMRQSNRGINQAKRPLASLDKVCLDCHRNQRALGTDTLGVGKNF